MLAYLTQRSVGLRIEDMRPIPIEFLLGESRIFVIKFRYVL